MEFANRFDFSFDGNKNTDTPYQYRFIESLWKGTGQYAYNMMQGKYEGYNVMIFDYHYLVPAIKQPVHCDITVMTLELEIVCPELLIIKEKTAAKIGYLLGFKDIDMDSYEFSKAFNIKSKCKKFAYDICNTGMIEYLLENKDLCIEIDKDILAFTFDVLSADEIEHNLGRLVQVRKLMPDFIFNITTDDPEA